jgi:hypothetical protein
MLHWQSGRYGMAVAQGTAKSRLRLPGKRTDSPTSSRDADESHGAQNEFGLSTGPLAINTQGAVGRGLPPAGGD